MFEKIILSAPCFSLALAALFTGNCLASTPTAVEPSGPVPRLGQKEPAKTAVSDLKKEMRGLWVWSRNVTTPEKADAAIASAKEANLNTIYLLVWLRFVPYESKVDQPYPRWPTTPKDFDIIKYMVEKCHKQGMEFHAWFFNGFVHCIPEKTPTEQEFFKRHGDWLTMDIFGHRFKGFTYGFIDFCNPEVRKWQTSVMLEVLRLYPEIDGLHFDHIRDPQFKRNGDRYGYTKVAREGFKKLHGVDPVDFAVTTFPVAARFDIHTYARAKTAAVHAETDDSLPVISSNTLGKGMAYMIGFECERYTLPVCEFTILGILKKFGADKTVQIPSLARRRPDFIRLMNQHCLKLVDVAEWDIGKADLNLPIVIPRSYIITGKIAQNLEEWVRRGGNILFLGAPTSAEEPARPILRKMLGFRGKAVNRLDKYITVKPVGKADFLPIGKCRFSLAERRKLESAWRKYRRDQITKLVRAVATGARKIKPTIQISAAVMPDRKEGYETSQDWYRWLDEGLLDFAVTMAYTGSDTVFERWLEEWKSSKAGIGRIIPGLAIHKHWVKKNPAKAISQIETGRKAGVRGFVFFNHLCLSQDHVKAMVEGPFKEKALPYHPPHLIPTERKGD